MIVVKDNNGNYHQVTDGTSTVIPSLNVSQEILWENPNPTQSFAAQTVNLSDNPFNYDYIRILYNDDPRNSATGYSIIDIKPSDSNFKATIGLVIYSDSHRVTRQIYSPTENSITFNSTKAEDGTTWDGWLIPYQIIGIKFLDTLNYSTKEQYTGKHWIDGKKIYEKTISLNLSVSSNTWNNTGIQMPNIETIIHSTAMGIDIGYTNTIGYLGSCIVTLDSANNLMYNSMNVSATLKYITIQYTKTTE